MTPILLTAVLFAADAQAQAQAVEKALIAAEPELHRCWERAAADDYRVEGQMALSVTVGPGGKVDKVLVKADSTGQAGLEDCVKRVFDGVRFEGGAFDRGDSVEVPVTFKAESNVTIKAGDAKSFKLNGAQGVAKVLVDQKTARADKASMVWVDLQPGARLVRPSPKGAAFVFVRRGSATVGGQVVGEDDVVIFPDGSAPLIVASNRTELVMLFVPPGPEQSFRAGAKIPEASPGGPAPTIVKRNAAEKHDILDGKGSVVMYVQSGDAAVEKIRLGPGAVLPEHTHDGSAELLYFVGGTGELVVDGDKYPIQGFTAVYVPPGAKHSFTAGENQIDAIQFFTPAGPEQRLKGGK
jgi:TonB family protein